MARSVGQNTVRRSGEDFGLAAMLLDHPGYANSLAREGDVRQPELRSVAAPIVNGWCG